MTVSYHKSSLRPSGGDMRFPSDHRSQALSSGVSTWMGDHPGPSLAVGNTWCSRHMAKPRPQVGRVCWSHHQNTPPFTATKCDWSLDLSKKKKLILLSILTGRILLSFYQSEDCMMGICKERSKNGERRQKDFKPHNYVCHLY